MVDDEFGSYTPGLTAPASEAVEISPSNNNDLEFVTRGIFVGSSGDLALKMYKGPNIILRNVQAGMVYAVRAVRVRATGTTAGDLVGLR